MIIKCYSGIVTSTYLSGYVTWPNISGNQIPVQCQPESDSFEIQTKWTELSELSYVKIC